MSKQPSEDIPINKFDPNKIRVKTFIVEKLINFLIIIRMYVTEFPLWAWAISLILLYMLKLKRQGNIPSSMLTLIAILFSISGEFFKIDFIFLIAPIFAGISHFFSYTTYWFPKINEPIGIRQEVLQNDLYLLELYPIKKNQNTKRKVLFWNHKLEFNKILEHIDAKNPIYQGVAKFVLSALNKIKLYFAQGDEEPTKQAIVFSHGRTATPFMYSQLLTSIITLQSQKMSVFAVQHTQKKSTDESQHSKIKRYRQIQVQARAAQMFTSVQHCKNKRKIILMGHSYGGATAVQTYHSLPLQQKQKVSHIILLDPWLFPLTDAKLIQQIKCPILILSAEYFVENEDIYNRNKQFINANKKNAIYMVWKRADHLHQTDLSFLIGNIFDRIKNPSLSLQMLNKNVSAIKLFLKDHKMNEKKMRQTFEADILPVDFKPQKWNNYLSL